MGLNPPAQTFSTGGFESKKSSDVESSGRIETRMDSGFQRLTNFAFETLLRERLLKQESSLLRYGGARRQTPVRQSSDARLLLLYFFKVYIVARRIANQILSGPMRV
jgi:hypothetical protein